jgi:uncharacterized protein
MAERLARAEGADLEIVRAAALLHDAQPVDENDPSRPERQRADHHHVSASFARRVLEAEGWADERISAVQHCIRAHRFRDPSEQPLTLEAQVLFDADKLDALGAIGAARAIAFAALKGQPPYGPPSERFINSGEKEAGEAHSAYHEYLFKLQKLRERLYTASAQSLAVERHRFLAEFFTRLAAEARGEQ